MHNEVELAGRLKNKNVEVMEGAKYRRMMVYQRVCRDADIFHKYLTPI